MIIKKNNELIINIFFTSIKNIFDPKIFKWVLWTITLTIISIGILSYSIFEISKSLITIDIPFIGGYIDNLLIYSVILITIWGSTILFVPLSTMMFSIFQENIIKEIEKKYYPEINQEIKTKYATFLFAGIKLLGWTILINIFLLPFALFFGGAFWWLPLTIIINGWILSKEYLEAIGLRRENKFLLKETKNKLFWPCWIFGIISAILFLIPVINLFVPALLTLLMLHIFNKKYNSGPLPD